MSGRVTTVVAVVALLTCAAMASAEMFLLLSVAGVEGTSRVPGYENWIECAGLQHNIPGLPKPLQLLRPCPQLLEGSFEVPHDFEGFDLMKVIDKASPKLFLMCQEGRRLGPVKLALMSIVDEKPVIHVTFDLQDPVISSLILRAPGFGDRADLLLPIEKQQPMLLLKLMPIKIHWRRLLTH